MNTIKSVEDANAALRQLWKKYFDKWPQGLRRLWPMQYPNLEPKPILFVGMNPSCSGDRDRWLLQEKKALCDAVLIGQVINAEQAAISNYRYFAPFNDLAGEQRWNHIDLLAVRETSQQAVCTTLTLNDALLAPFVSAQIEIALAIIALLAPNIVFVSNAKASKIMKSALGSTVKWDDSIGTYRDDTKAWFFSGMLSWPHALDTYSTERLKWHIDWVGKKAASTNAVEHNEMRNVVV